MKPMIFIVALTGFALTQIAPASAQKSALDGYQFDGVSSDAELKVEGQTRRHWLDNHPVQAKEYWAAWDCKGKPCDTKWYANIRAKAALVKRTHRDPKPANSASSKEAKGGESGLLPVV